MNSIKVLPVLFTALLAGCYAVPVYQPQPVRVYATPTISNQAPPYPQVPDGSIAQPVPMPQQTPQMVLPPPPVAYQLVCYVPGYWVWNGAQNVCVYPVNSIYYGPGYYWGPAGMITFRLGVNVWGHNGGTWRGGAWHGGGGWQHRGRR